MISGPPSVNLSHTLLQLPHRGTRSEAVPATDSDIADREGIGVPSNDTRTCLAAECDSLTWCTLPATPRPASSTLEEREEPREGSYLQQG
jgi:hypothetical protein